jgi:hypothetical protein
MSPRRCVSPAGRLTIWREGEELIAATSGQLCWAAASAWKSIAAGAAAGGWGGRASLLAVQRSAGSGFLAVLLAWSAAGKKGDGWLGFKHSGGGFPAFFRRRAATTLEWPEV